MEIKFTYPQIYFETKTVEVEENFGISIVEGCQEEQADFIYNQLTDLEKEWIPRQGRKSGSEAIELFLDCDFIHVLEIEKPKTFEQELDKHFNLIIDAFNKVFLKELDEELKIINQKIEQKFLELEREHISMALDYGFNYVKEVNVFVYGPPNNFVIKAALYVKHARKIVDEILKMGSKK